MTFFASTAVVLKELIKGLIDTTGDNACYSSEQMCNAEEASKRKNYESCGSTKHTYLGMIIAQPDSTQIAHHSCLC